MGINGLWPVLSPASQRNTLQCIALEDGFMKHPGVRGYRVGIDISGWLYAVCFRHNSTKNPELAMLFARCSRILQLPIFPLFVFDGPNRPRVKRGKQVRGSDHWLTKDLKAMLDAFGFRWIVASGEAEADLAEMSKLGMLDAIMTQDSDAVVFGARTILRLDSNFADTGQVIKYEAADIESLGLDKAALILVALLVGGDYSGGVKGCGIETALKLAKAGLGTQLIEAVEHRANLNDWREDMRKELHKPSKNYKRALTGVVGLYTCRVYVEYNRM